MDRAGSNGLIVVAIVHEDGSKVANDVDHKEDGALFAPHRQVASSSIAFNW